MDGAVFYSYKPYLHLALSRECIITFNENGVYIAKTPEEEKLLREYAKNIRSSTWKNTRRIITMRIKTLDIMVKKSVTVMAENDEKLEKNEKRLYEA